MSGSIVLEAALRVPAMRLSGAAAAECIYCSEQSLRRGLYFLK